MQKSPSPLLLANGTPIGELHYEEPAQPWFRGNFVPFSNYAEFSDVLDHLAWNPVTEVDVERLMAARKKAERTRLQIRYPNGSTKSLNRTMFQITERSRFSHRMCVEDFIQAYKADALGLFKGKSSSRVFCRSIYRLVMLYLELGKLNLQRLTGSNDA